MSLLYLYFTTPLENHASWAAELWAERGRESEGGGVQVKKEGAGGMKETRSKNRKEDGRRLKGIHRVKGEGSKVQ